MPLLPRKVYFNDDNLFLCRWLKNLYPQAHVDYRDIHAVNSEKIKDLTVCHFFAGIGGWEYALQLAGWPRTRSVWTGSCPCQPFSTAGHKKGLGDKRHLWPIWYSLIKRCHPPTIFGEQVASNDGWGWLSVIQADLEKIGYDVAAVDLAAAGVGAPHKRQRIWFVADSGGERSKRHRRCERPSRQRPWGAFGKMDLCQVLESPFNPGNGFPQPLIHSLVDGVSSRVGRQSAYGNSIVPQVAAEFISAFLDVEEQTWIK